MQSTISFKGIGIHGVAAPSEANDKIGVVEVRIWWHFSPVRIPRIPIVVSITKNAEMNPLGGVVGRAF
jgi:hypothetical protein